MVNYKGRQENLVSLGDRPVAERKAIARAGGLASGRKRRKKAEFLQSMEIALDIICDDDFFKELENDISDIIGNTEQDINNG